MTAVFRKRVGFTLLEVLGAAVILTIALLGISAAAAGMLKKSKAPNKVETASILANERLSYFRSQSDPFRAVGGTHYNPPNRGETDWGKRADANNRFNCAVTGNDGTNFPTLFVREYLYSAEEGQFKNADGTDSGRNNQNRELVNTVPDLPTTVPPYVRVFPNVDGTPTVDAVPAGLNAGVFTFARRANDDLRVQDGDALPPSIAFVREVWVQTNHPEFTPLGLAAPALVVTPNVVRFLPPYTVAVTVKTYARIPEVTRLAAIRPVIHANTGLQKGDASLAYDPTRPLAEVVGFFGLRRLGR